MRPISISSQPSAQWAEPSWGAEPVKINLWLPIDDYMCGKAKYEMGPNLYPDLDHILGKKPYPEIKINGSGPEFAKRGNEKAIFLFSYIPIVSKSLTFQRGRKWWSRST